MFYVRKQQPPAALVHCRGLYDHLCLGELEAGLGPWSLVQSGNRQPGRLNTYTPTREMTKKHSDDAAPPDKQTTRANGDKR